MKEITNAAKVSGMKLIIHITKNITRTKIILRNAFDCFLYGIKRNKDNRKRMKGLPINPVSTRKAINAAIAPVTVIMVNTLFLN